MFTRQRIWKWSLLLLAVTTASVLMYRHHKRYKHFAVHDPQMVYRSAWLDADVFRELIEDHQIRTVLNLCEPNELGAEQCVSQRQAVRGSGAKLIEMPMPASKLDPADPEIAKFVDVLANPENYPMLVHCQHGVTRTAKVLVMYDILYRHMTAEQSIAAMPLFGHDDYPVSVRAFAHNFEEQHHRLYRTAQGKLEILRR